MDELEKLSRRVRKDLNAKIDGLREEIERLNLILDNVPAGIAAIIIKDGIPLSIQVNERLSRVLGIKRGKTDIRDLNQIMAYVHPDDREICQHHFRELLKTKKEAENIYRLRNGITGQYIWVHLEGKFVSNPHDNGLHTVYLVYTNVTDMKEKEFSLIQSRKIYDDTIMAAKLTMWEYDIAAHRITFSDNEFTQNEIRKFGWPPVIENVPDALEEFIDGADMQMLRHMYEEVEAGHDVTCDFWYKERPGQEPRCQRGTYKVVLDDVGKPVKAYGLGQNITAEKDVEERYIREMNNLEKYQDNNLLAKAHINLTKNLVLEYTSYGQLEEGLKEGERYDVASKAFLSFVYNGEEKSRVIELLDRKILNKRYQNGETETSLRYRRLHPSGVPVWVSTVIHTYMMPNTGDLECFVYTYDVSAQAMEERVISKLADLGFVELGVVEPKTGNWNCYRFNQQYGKSTLWESKGNYNDDLIRYVQDEVLLDQREETLKALSLDTITKALDKGAVAYYYSNAVRRSDGSVGQIRFVISYLDENQENIFYSMSDITQQFEQEHKQIAILEAAKLEAEKSNEAKSSFLSSMSHDLRTPLNGIIGFTNVAIKETDPQKKQDYLSKVQDSAHLLLDLVNDTLELSRIESGKMTLNEEVIDAALLGVPVVTALRPSAELKNITIEVDVSRLPHDMVWVDKLKAQKVMLNLLSNAIKYTPSGGWVKFTVEKILVANQKYAVQIIIEDNGIGMKPDFLKYIYEPFVQEKRAETKTVLGTGLGLTIVKRIVTLMNGEIKVASELGKGTKFTALLPLRFADEKSAKQATQEIQNNPEILAGKSILLFEDNYLNAEIATVLLKEMGMVVDVAQNGQIGVDKFAAAGAGKYDAILMDIRMPVMDGYTATAAIRHMDREDAGSIPIIALTADAFEEDLRRFKEVSMNGYVLKPINPPKLYEELMKNIK